MDIQRISTQSQLKPSFAKSVIKLSPKPRMVRAAGKEAPA
ncbi:hypothetical protein HMPREF9946_00344 [Acetobacteraceae bacterium AT-5844]|nr:hypothetical protein HMPREF9946_00344 [Acetobacteraceae bacterium AT-5844]